MQRARARARTFFIADGEEQRILIIARIGGIPLLLRNPSIQREAGWIIHAVKADRASPLERIGNAALCTGCIHQAVIILGGDSHIHAHAGLKLHHIRIHMAERGIQRTEGNFHISGNHHRILHLARSAHHCGA